MESQPLILPGCPCEWLSIFLLLLLIFPPCLWLLAYLVWHVCLWIFCVEKIEVHQASWMCRLEFFTLTVLSCYFFEVISLHCSLTAMWSSSRVPSPTHQPHPEAHWPPSPWWSPGYSCRGLQLSTSPRALPLPLRDLAEYSGWRVRTQGTRPDVTRSQVQTEHWGMGCYTLCRCLWTRPHGQGSATERILWQRLQELTTEGQVTATTSFCLWGGSAWGRRSCLNLHPGAVGTPDVVWSPWYCRIGGRCEH